MNLKSIVLIFLFIFLFFQAEVFLMVLKDPINPIPGVNNDGFSSESQNEEKEVLSIENNPFLTFDEEESFSPLIYRETITMNLTAVFYTPPNSKILVDGRIYEEGDIVDNKRIIKIRPEEAILKDTRGEYLIKLNGVLGEIQ